MLNAQFQPFPTLITQRMVLRQLSRSDLPEIHLQRSDKEMIRYLDRDGDPSLEYTSQWLDMVLDSEQKNETITWGMTLKGKEKLIGTICYWNFKKEHYRVEIGYGLYTTYQRSGLMQEAMHEVIKYGFSTMNLHSIEANVNPSNQASIKLLERNGFVREAYFKENYHHNGRFLDSAVYSLLRHNWMSK